MTSIQEAIKPIMSSDSSLHGNAEIKKRTQHVLYIVMDTILRLMHPFMPYVTEELWQRLPGKSTLSTPESSIMIQPYPQSVDGWSSQAVEDHVALTNDVVHGIRSMRTDFDIPRPQVLSHFFKYVVCS